MRLNKIYSLLLILSFALSSCEELMEPRDDNHATFERVLRDADFAEGLLITAYTKLPTNGLSYNEVATDDAVSNVKLNSYRRMATGQWSALSNPVNQWDNCNSGILYCNHFLSIVDTVTWKWSNAEISKLMTQRFTGEAYALRAILKYYLLVTTGGVGENGELLGIPIYDKFIETEAEFNTPRSSFEESIASIYADLDKALTFLTVDDYKDISNLAAIPAGFSWVKDYSSYNTVFGNVAIQRISGRIVKAFKARVALLAASPAFNLTNDLTLWEDAANYAGASLNSIGGISGLDPVGQKWYLSTYVDAIKITSGGADQKEILWRRPRGVSNSRESANFPPSLFGSGNVNPTQNLVDAFPMANGYPITDASSTYNPVTPYANRDPRFALYIAYNGCTMKGQKINTGIGGGVNAKDSIATSTRTGYYLRKLLREDVNMDPKATTTKNHYEIHMRYTELFLIYAEAANEAWGPDGTGTVSSFKARDVISAIRKRAGIKQPDVYLATITTKEAMRELIRNERRIELCFEDFRFWDLRRWNADLTETAKGVNINKAGDTFNYVEVETRDYNNEYMHYGPLPQNEVLKFNALIQNKGW
ncbi:MAG: RagB/SusD family nutrient uptake outer membrane protein [Bacteroidales bacterium]|nr:RagB/SusD family nutrient uptake outer membrane protein [Bacteroidales bacterium]